MEIELFRAIMAHKPVGADRHFQMIFIKALLSSRIHTAALSTDQLWVKLDTLYNMEELHEAEVNPFHQNKAREFVLPDEFTELKTKKFPRSDCDPSTLSPHKISTSGSSIPPARINTQKRMRKSLRSGDQSAEGTTSSSSDPPPQSPNRRSEHSSPSDTSVTTRKHRR
ncbi:MRG-binding protein [Fasciolopsis buskii]|uniref:MRG-binding protein n=1 Tax=Fasciolopsis buskii TaxID=27845 RepID=A0A8E0RKP0_9TREM|nr:MRG-binding protein [Fasciolopsis buski]